MTSKWSTNKNGIVGKICGKCKIWYQLNDFNKDSSNLDGLRYCCKNCMNLKCSNYYIKNKDDISVKRKKDYINNRSKYIIRNLAWKNLNPNYWIDYYNSNYIKVLKRINLWKKANPDKVKLYQLKSKDYRKRNLKGIILFDNPFPKSIPVDWHHISDGFKFAIPRDMHELYHCGRNTKLHRYIIEPIIEQIYDISYIVM